MNTKIKLPPVKVRKHFGRKGTVHRNRKAYHRPSAKRAARGEW